MKTHVTQICIVALMMVGFCFGAQSVSAQSPEERAAEIASQPASYTPIVGIPGIDGGSLSTEEYVRALYYLAITVAALLAVYKIMFAGIKYMFHGTGAMNKEEAKKDIQGAVFGLLIVLAAVIILQTINVNLTTLNVLGNAPSLNEIEGGEAPVRSVPIGTTMPNNPNNPAVRNLIANCEGDVERWGASQGGGGRSGGGGTVGSIGCFRSASDVVATPGTTLPLNQYAPTRQDQVLNAFANSCRSNNGYLQSADNCIQQTDYVEPEVQVPMP